MPRRAIRIPAVRAKLTAFVISGVFAGIGGALFTHLNQSFTITSYNAGESFSVFTSAVIGGLGSLGGAFLGALYLRGTRWFIPSQEWQLLSTGAGVLLVLLLLPGGLGALWVKLATRGSPARSTSAAAAGRSADRGARGTGGVMRKFLTACRHPGKWLREICGGEAAFPLVVLFGLNAVDELDRTAFAILLPNIRDEFDLDNTKVLSLVAIASVAALALQVPIAQYADRSRRVPLVVAGAVSWAMFSGMTGLATGVVMLTIARSGSAIGKGRHRPDAQLAARRLLPDRVAQQRVQHPSRGQRCRFVCRSVVRRPARVRVRLARAVPGVRHPDGGVRGAGAATARARPWAVGTSGDGRQRRCRSPPRRSPPSFAESWRTVQKIESLQRLWWSLPFLATSLIGFVTLASLLYEQEFDLDERARGCCRRDRRAVPTRRPGGGRAHHHSQLRQRHDAD